MDGLTKLANEIGHARDYGQMASAAARKLLDIVADLNAQRMAALSQQADEIWAMVAERYAELPKDADGEYIHIGDVMERMERCGKVVALQLSDNPWGDGNHWAIQLEGENAPTVLDAFFRHHKPPTIEDVLREMLYKAHIYDEREMEFLPDLIAEYAARLQLKEDE